ncbi:AraC family transcriptional regulator [Hoeflea sp. BAL378]|uniref:helix-turn-helix domain-containing protein n=1 Tax=Hoeflea sp. BAL378 TaxID=1547437 RepID=UPI00068F0384|nr:AraC family transcriptional regulator [Hoeflea sp. BAL378]
MSRQRFDLRNSQAEAARRDHAWRGFSVEHVVPARGDSFAYEWQSDQHFCALHDIVLEDGGIRAGNDRENHQKDLRGSLTYVPKGAAVEGWSELSKRSNAYVAIYFSPDQLHEELDQRFADDWRVRLYFRDPDVGASLRRFSALLAQEDCLDDLFAETLGLMTVLSLQKSNLSLLSRRHTLPGRALSAIVDYVEAHLGQQISLDDLATVAGLSRFHFNRAFKATTGESPYQYVLTRRIEAAQRLLSDRSLSIEQVAAAVGFRNPSHFQKAFRARTGVNPSDFAKSL